MPKDYLSMNNCCNFAENIDYECIEFLYTTKITDYSLNLHIVRYLSECGVDSMEFGTDECR